MEKHCLCISRSFASFIKPVLLLVLVVLLFGLPCPAAAASGMTDVRVGLAALYGKKPSVTIKNTTLGLGFCIQDSYICEQSLSGKGGFTFTPATGYFYVLDRKFAGYEEARAAAEEISGFGVTAYPAVLSRDVWTVYAGGSKEKETAQGLFQKLKGKGGYTWQPISSDNGHRILVKAEPDTFLIDAAVYGQYPQFKALTTNSAGIAAVDLGERAYRGRIEIGRYGKTSVTAVNILNVEVYLYSVVPCEMPGSWPVEALKAQAVCARSFALTKTGYLADSSLTKAYTLEDTVNTQVYKGIAYETERTSRVVRDTIGETVNYNGKPIMAFFYSTSGGHTEDAVNVWGLSQEYYSGIPDPYETEPERKPWLVTMNKKQIGNLLEDFGFSIGPVKALVPQIVTSSNRIYSLKLVGNTGNAVLQTNTIRDILELASTKFKMIESTDIPDEVAVRTGSGIESLRISEACILTGDKEIKPADPELTQFIVRSSQDLMNFPVTAPASSDSYLFAGMGYGHGVGLSQSGAKGMAEAGFSYKEIIEYYYKGTSVQRLK